MSKLTEDQIDVLIERIPIESLPAVFSSLVSEIIKRALIRESVEQLKIDSLCDYDELSEWFEE